MADSQSKDTRRHTVFDVVEEQIAQTYAQGFLGAMDPAENGNAVADLIAIDEEILDKHPRLLKTLDSAFLDNDQRIEMIDRVFGERVSPVVVKLLKVMSSHGRIGILGSVIRQAKHLFNNMQNRAEVLVRLAHPVNDELLEQIGQTIREKMGVEPVMTVEIDADLVGGLEIRVGDTVFDGSVRTAFAKAHKTIVEQTIEAIESQPERFTVAS